MKYKFFSFFILTFFALSGLFLMSPSEVSAGSTDTLVFSDNFDSLTSGSLSGQNGWTTASAAWTVTATTTGKNVVGGNANYNLSPISQTSVSTTDTRIVVDFLAPASGASGVQTWLRRTSSASTARGYDFYHYLDGKFYLAYINGTTVTSLSNVSVSLTPGQWYTVEFEAINDGSGNPVLKGWVYPQGTSKPASPNVTYTDTAKLQSSGGYAGVGGFNSAVTADNVYIYSGDSGSPTVPSTPVSLSASASSTQITLSWTAPSNGGSAITDYLVEYRTGGNSFATFNDGVSTATTATVTGLATSTAYDFKVSAINSVGTSTAATVSATTTSGIAPTTPTLVASTGVAGTGNVTTSGLNTNGATLLIVTASVYGTSASTVSITDSGGNTWHALTNRAAPQNVQTAIWYAYDKSGSSLVTSANHTVTITSSGTFYPAINFSAWSGILTGSDPLDVQNGNSTNGGSISTNNISPSQNNELVITSFGSDTAGTYTISSPFTVLRSQSFTLGQNMGNAVGYSIQTTAASAGGTWSTTGSGNLATAIASFKAGNTSVSSTSPSAPQTLQALSGSNQVSLNWLEPSSNGGSPIIDYLVEYRTGGNSFATFNDGVSTATSTIVTGLSLETPYDFKVSAINAIGTSTAATISATTTSSNITITSPSRNVAASSSVATIGVNRNECSTTFYIPYIQTSSSLTVSATVDSSALPSGGGVKFVLTNTQSNQTVLYDLSSPFSVTFTNLAKGEYTLDTYIVDSNQVVQVGETNHDIATNIGIGDIYVAIGDSVTEGYDGMAYNVSPYTDWTNVPVKSNDNRNYPQCGISSGYYQDHWQEVSHHIPLNNTLENYYGYPVFILNEGVAGITTSGYITRTGLTTWQNRINALQPNKWLIHLGINDGNGSSGSQNNLQTIVNTLINTYGATSTDIVLAVPSTRTGWQPYINNLVINNNLTRGPDFGTFYANNTSPTLYVGVHPNVAGHVQMGRLWGVSIISPKNVSVQQSATNVDVSWDNLASVEPSIAGYKVYYGTSSSTLNTVIDVGNNTSTTISSGLTEGQTYYFAVQGYDNDAYVRNLTSTSTPVFIQYSQLDTTVPELSSISTNSFSTTGVTISWITDEAATSQVEYGLSSVYAASSALDSNLTTSHSVTLSSLAANTIYHYRVISTDVSGNTATSSDQTFVTQADSSSGGSSGSGGSSHRSSSSGRSSVVVPTTPIQVPAQEPGPVITPTTFVRNLALQARGEDVKTLQQFLIAKGFLATGNDTGYFGPLTYQALVQYQTAMGIYPTSGYFGPITRSVIVATASMSTTTVPTNSASTVQTFTKNLKFGTSDAEVRFLQQYLNSNGFSVSVVGAGSTGQETTYFGSATQAALIRFQQFKGITPAVGYFGPITRQYIATH